ncbi:MAG: hypothetical protein Ct9H300mP14_03140 [Gammaproteobacteria bacterium]|nr:MAG: hypothetical protein Ct9H300mP14_03140 [Gammaproteobacteria bacterium]
MAFNAREATYKSRSPAKSDAASPVLFEEFHYLKLGPYRRLLINYVNINLTLYANVRFVQW